MRAGPLGGSRERAQSSSGLGTDVEPSVVGKLCPFQVTAAGRERFGVEPGLVGW
ncbi:MAG: hypothetical protein ACYDEA_07860 [Candidatus Dormibacteria bacterium]